MLHKFLLTIPDVKAIPHDVLYQLAYSSTLIRMPLGNAITKQGARGDGIYIVLSGICGEYAVQKGNYEKKRWPDHSDKYGYLLTRIPTGASFGSLDLENESPDPSSLVAINDVHCLWVSELLLLLFLQPLPLGPFLVQSANTGLDFPSNAFIKQCVCPLTPRQTHAAATAAVVTSVFGVACLSYPAITGPRH